MPLTVNVGLSRKASENYQSHGTSINLTAELDQALLGRPEELQEQIADLYAQAADGLRRGSTVHRPATAYGPQASANAAFSAGPPQIAPMTASQRRAILAIAERLQLDPVHESQGLFRLDLADLNIRQASQLIDYLKTGPPQPVLTSGE